MFAGAQTVGVVDEHTRSELGGNASWVKVYINRSEGFPNEVFHPCKYDLRLWPDGKVTTAAASAGTRPAHKKRSECLGGGAPRWVWVSGSHLSPRPAPP